MHPQRSIPPTPPTPRPVLSRPVSRQRCGASGRGHGVISPRQDGSSRVHALPPPNQHAPLPGWTTAREQEYLYTLCSKSSCGQWPAGLCGGRQAAVSLASRPSSLPVCPAQRNRPTQRYDAMERSLCLPSSSPVTAAELDGHRRGPERRSSPPIFSRTAHTHTHPTPWDGWEPGGGLALFSLPRSQVQMPWERI